MTTTHIAELREKEQPTHPVAVGPFSVFGDIQSFESAQRMAKALMTADVVPQQYRQNLGNTLIAIELAHRTGASVLAVMQNIAVVHGKPSWEAKFLIGAVNTCGKFSPLRYEMTGDKGKDTWGCRAWAYDLRTEEKLDGPEVTIAMSKAEGWYQKNGSKWQTMPEVMLRYRSASFWVKQFAPEISLGMQTAEELHDVYDTRKMEDGSFAIDELRETAPIAVPDTEPQISPESTLDVYPKRIGDGPNDWMDADGVAYNPKVFGWDKNNKMPSHVRGVFRVARGKKEEAAEYRASVAAKGNTEPESKDSADDWQQEGEQEKAPQDFGDLE